MITYPTNKLQKVLLGGGCEQRNLPSGYTQVEYLESNSQPYIDTGIAGGTNDLEIGCKFCYTKYFKYGAIYGNWIDDTYNVTRLILGANSGQAYLNNNRLSSPGGNTAVNLSINTIHTFVSQYTTYTIDGITATVTLTTTGPTNNNNIVLFNRSTTNPNTSRDIGLEVYSFYIKKNGTLVRNLIPCRRNSDNVLGMYDTVTGNFLTNAGTGSFTAGADVVPTPTPDTPIDIVCNNGAVKVRHQSGLPLGYTKLDYLESTGTQYIDTGLTDVVNAEFGLEAQLTESVTTGFPTLFGAIENNISGSFAYKVVFGASSSSGVLYTQCGNGLGYTRSTIANDTNKHTFKLVNTTNTQTLTVDNSTVVGNYNVSTGTQYSLYLFARNNVGTVASFVSAKIYSCYTKLNGVLVQNFLPVKRNSDNVLGMYDMVTGEFFTNQGTGTFIAGSEVSDPIEIYTNGTVETVAINLFNQNNYLDAYCSTGGKITSSPTSRCYIIPCKPLTEYRFIFDNTNVNINGRCVINGFYNMPEIGMKTNQGIYNSFTKKPHNKTFTTNAGINYLLFWITYSSSNTSSQQAVNKAILYETGSNTATAENLFKVGTYQDVQSVLDGVVTRNVGVKVLDSTEDWETTYSSSAYRVYSLAMTDCGRVSNWSVRTGFCTHFDNYIGNTSPTYGNVLLYTYWQNITGTYLRFKTDVSYATIDIFKAWLADQYNSGTPVIVVYPLAEPTTEQVTPQPLAGNTATVTAGSIDNLPIESSTIAELKKRYIGNKEVNRVYIGDNLVWENN